MTVLPRDFKVVAKGLKSKDEVPFVLLKTDVGEKLSLHLAGKYLLDDYKIGEIWTVKIAKEQKILVKE